MDALAVDIHDVADGLESIERNAHRQQDGIHTEAVVARDLVAYPRKHVEHAELKAREFIQDIGEEIGIFEIEQCGQIDNHADGQHNISTSISPSRMQPFARKEII